MKLRINFKMKKYIYLNKDLCSIINTKKINHFYVIKILDLG